MSLSNLDFTSSYYHVRTPPATVSNTNDNLIIANKGYVDNAVGTGTTGVATLAGNNAFTGQNSFSGNVTLSGQNSYTGDNTFSKYPVCTDTSMPTDSNAFVKTATLASYIPKPATAVTAGTFNSVTVNDDGLVTSGTTVITTTPSTVVTGYFSGSANESSTGELLYYFDNADNGLVNSQFLILSTGIYRYTFNFVILGSSSYNVGGYYYLTVGGETVYHFSLPAYGSSSGIPNNVGYGYLNSSTSAPASIVGLYCADKNTYNIPFGSNPSASNGTLPNLALYPIQSVTYTNRILINNGNGSYPNLLNVEITALVNSNTDMSPYLQLFGTTGTVTYSGKFCLTKM